MLSFMVAVMLSLPFNLEVVEPGDLGAKIGWHFVALCLCSSYSNAWREISCFLGCITLMGSEICPFYLKSSKVVMHLHPRGSKCQSSLVSLFYSLFHRRLR